MGHLSVQSLAADSQNARGMGDISLGGLQRLLHGGLGKVFKIGGSSQRRHCHRRRRVRHQVFHNVIREVTPTNAIFMRIEHGAGGSQNAGELPQVTRPSVLLHFFQYFRTKANIAIRVQSCQQSVSERLKICSLAQWGELNGETVDSVVQVVAKPALVRLFA